MLQADAAVIIFTLLLQAHIVRQLNLPEISICILWKDYDDSLERVIQG